MLIVFGGLPGTGKTTIARQVARACRATYIRIDAIEQAIRSANVLSGEVGPAGYMVAYALSQSNLGLGQSVVADSVNPLAITRDAWRSVAASAAVPIIEVEIVCSDIAEHRRRVETRTSDIPGHILPGWATIEAREYEMWSAPHLVIDTAAVTPEEATAQVIAAARQKTRL